MFLDFFNIRFRIIKFRGNTAVFRLVTGYGWNIVNIFLGCDHKKNGRPRNSKKMDFLFFKKMIKNDKKRIKMITLDKDFFVFFIFFYFIYIVLSAFFTLIFMVLRLFATFCDFSYVKSRKTKAVHKPIILL
jgi:hypothetical protein